MHLDDCGEMPCNQGWTVAWIHNVDYTELVWLISDGPTYKSPRALLPDLIVASLTSALTHIRLCNASILHKLYAHTVSQNMHSSYTWRDVLHLVSRIHVCHWLMTNSSLGLIVLRGPEAKILTEAYALNSKERIPARLYPLTFSKLNAFWSQTNLIASKVHCHDNWICWLGKGRSSGELGVFGGIDSRRSLRSQRKQWCHRLNRGYWPLYQGRLFVESGKHGHTPNDCGSNKLC